MAENNASNFVQLATSSGNATQAVGTQVGYTFTGASGITTSASGSTVTITGSGGGSGTIIQQIRTKSNTPGTISSVLLIGSTPTTANSTLFLSLSVTPTVSTNILLFDLSLVAFSSFDYGFFLFAGSTFLTSFSARSAGPISDVGWPISGFYYQAAGTTSATTYAIYGASVGGSLSTNGDGGSAVYGLNTSSFMVTEVKP